MPTDLEKQFFDTFGIEPKEIITCIIEEDWLNDYHLKTWYPISEWMKNNAPCEGKKECSNKCNCYQVKNKYPQITDKHYLELICMVNERRILPNLDVDNLKEYILKELCTMIISESFKRQVQAIFKESEQE